jgi:hypothetical protein
MTCEECKYWDDYKDNIGACHRHPPTLTFGVMSLAGLIQGAELPPMGTPVIDDDEEESETKGQVIGTVPGVEKGVWITTASQDWCGEFEAKDIVETGGKE